MILNKHTAKKTADHLLQINPIKLNPKNPFTWASGWKSPIYCDNRITLSYPSIRTYLKKQLSEQVLELYGKPDVIAGVATGAIGLGALVADYLDLPFVYVRPEAKKHGRQNQIEGTVKPGQNVVVIEDLISTGKSSLHAVDALRLAEVNVLGMIAIFTYGFPIANENFKKHQISLHTLSDYHCLLEHALENNSISPSELDILTAWSKAPQEWSI